jgi:multicomponent Na+:H+ antiporter subunit F
MSTTDWIEIVVFPALGLSILMVIIRFFRGPEISDRVISVDLLNTIWMGLIAAFCIYTKQSRLLDIAMIIALLSFLGTVAFASYIERRGEK